MAHLGGGVTHASDPANPSNVNRPRVAVVGGGYAGMAAAVSLAERGIRASIIESAKTLGGRARRVDYRGEVLDNGQHILSGAYVETLRLMELVGVAHNATKRTPLRLDMPPHFSLRAPRLIAPLHLAWALVFAKGLDWSDRFAAIRFMQALKRANFRVDAKLSVESLLETQRQPANLIRHLWQPLTVSALNTPIAIASAQVFVNVLRDALASTREASDLILPQTDLSALFPEAAATWLASHGAEIYRGVRVKKVIANASSFEIETDINTTNFDAVIVAIGPHQFDSISLPAGCVPPAPFDFEPIVTIYLKFDQPPTGLHF